MRSVTTANANSVLMHCQFSDYSISISVKFVISFMEFKSLIPDKLQDILMTSFQRKLFLSPGGPEDFQ